MSLFCPKWFLCELWQSQSMLSNPEKTTVFTRALHSKGGGGYFGGSLHGRFRGDAALYSSLIKMCVWV